MDDSRRSAIVGPVLPLRHRTGLRVVAAALALTGCRALVARKPASEEALTESYRSPNKLLTAHYPPDFAAKIVAKNVVLITRQPEDEAVSLLPIETPISNDLDETARVMMLAQDKKLTGHHEILRRHAACFGKFAGIEREGEFTPGLTGTYHRWQCVFANAGHVYEVSYVVPNSLRDRDEALLRRIIAATELH
jgi:hypothetical protein